MRMVDQRGPRAHPGGETDAAKPFIKPRWRSTETGPLHYFSALIEKADGDYDAA